MFQNQDKLEFWIQIQRSLHKIYLISSRWHYNDTLSRLFSNFFSDQIKCCHIIFFPSNVFHSIWIDSLIVITNYTWMNSRTKRTDHGVPSHLWPRLPICIPNFQDPCKRFFFWQKVFMYLMHLYTLTQIKRISRIKVRCRKYVYAFIEPRNQIGYLRANYNNCICLPSTNICRQALV
jgi:hypothetical protein